MGSHILVIMDPITNISVLGKHNAQTYLLLLCVGVPSCFAQPFSNNRLNITNGRSATTPIYSLRCNSDYPSLAITNSLYQASKCPSLTLVPVWLGTWYQFLFSWDFRVFIKPTAIWTITFKYHCVLLVVLIDH